MTRKKLTIGVIEKAPWDSPKHRKAIQSSHKVSHKYKWSRRGLLSPSSLKLSQSQRAGNALFWYLSGGFNIFLMYTAL